MSATRCLYSWLGAEAATYYSNAAKVATDSAIIATVVATDGSRSQLRVTCGSCHWCYCESGGSQSNLS